MTFPTYGSDSLHMACTEVKYLPTLFALDHSQSLGIMGDGNVMGRTSEKDSPLAFTCPDLPHGTVQMSKRDRALAALAGQSSSLVWLR